jgi:hypothetical protein
MCECTNMQMLATKHGTDEIWDLFEIIFNPK